MARYHVLVVSALTLGFACTDTKVTGPEAGALYEQYRDEHARREGFSIFIDGRKSPSEREALERVQASDIDSIRVIKGRRLILIYTRTGANPPARAPSR